MRNSVLMLLGPFLVFVLTATGRAFEPVTAFDDGFAFPSGDGTAESGVLFPGTEALTAGISGALGRTIPFGIDELAVNTLHAGASRGRLGGSVTVTTAGFTGYGEDTEKLGVSYRLPWNVAVGARVTRTTLDIDGFGTASAWGMDAGVVAWPWTSVTLAAAVENLTHARLGASHEAIDGATRCSAVWQPPGPMTLMGSVTDVSGWSPDISVGCLVRVASALTVGVIAGEKPERVGFLARVTVAGWQFAYRGSHHRDLGMSHGCSLGIALPSQATGFDR